MYNSSQVGNDVPHSLDCVTLPVLPKKQDTICHVDRWERNREKVTWNQAGSQDKSRAAYAEACLFSLDYSRKRSTRPRTWLDSKNVCVAKAKRTLKEQARNNRQKYGQFFFLLSARPRCVKE